MSRSTTFWVYMMASESGVLYIGVTNDLATRVMQHKKGIGKGFTARYRVTKLVWFECHGSIRVAIAREKEIKGWLRSRKIQLLESKNPHWRDLALPPIATAPTFSRRADQT